MHAHHTRTLVTSLVIFTMSHVFFKVNMIAIKTLIFIRVNQVTGLLQIKTDFSRTFARKKKTEAKRGCN